MTTKTSSDATKYLERLRGGPLTLGALLQSIRQTDEHTFTSLAEVFGVSRSHVCDVEKGRRSLSAERAARWADALGYPAELFVQLALQDEVNAAGLRLRVEVAAE